MVVEDSNDHSKKMLQIHPNYVRSDQWIHFIIEMYYLKGVESLD
jgi:hypothetical protein